MDTLIDFSASDANNSLLSEIQEQHVEQAILLLEPEVKRLEACKRHLGRLRAARAPIKRLSPELLSEIFGSLVQSYPGARVSDDSGVLTLPFLWSYVPWIARQVCTRWRDVAMANKRLWSHLRLVNPPFGSRPWERHPEEAWAQLTDFAITFIPEHGPVHITIDFSTPRDYEKPEMTSEYYHRCIRYLLYHFLGPIHDRLRTLDVSCNPNGVSSYLTDDSISRSLPSLEHLTLEYIDCDDIYQEHLPLGDVLSTATSLRTLRIFGVRRLGPEVLLRTYGTGLLRQIHWDLLQELRLECPITSSLTLTDYLQYLPRCSGLTHLTLEIFPGNNGSPRENREEGISQEAKPHSTSKNFVLPSLTHLYLESREYGFELFQHFTCPKLQLLCFLNGSTDPLSELVEFLRRSECKLRTLVDNSWVAHGLRFHSSERFKNGDPLLRSFLELLDPSVEQLYMNLPIEAATYQQIADGLLLPRLQAITLYNTPPQILLNRLGWLDQSLHSYEGIRYVRMCDPNAAWTDVRKEKEIAEELENTYEELKIYFYPNLACRNDWTDTSF